MILIIDNYDSFVYNLARYVAELGHVYVVKRNNAISIEEVKKINPTHIIISPGPGTPTQTGITLTLIQHFAETIPMLGVCLGHQAIAHAFGAQVIKTGSPVHGKATNIKHHGNSVLFANIPTMFRAGRYHSLLVEQLQLPEDLLITAESESGEIMALQHRHFSLYGVQFHPESVLTEYGHVLLNNFLNLR